MSAHWGTLAKKLEVSSVEKGISELGIAYQRVVERVLGFDHSWTCGPLFLERTTLKSPRAVRILSSLYTRRSYLQRRSVIRDRKGLIST